MNEALLQMHSDYQFQCIAAYEAQMIASTGVGKDSLIIDLFKNRANENPGTYRYIFNGSVPGLGPMHGSEGTFISGGTQSSPANAALSKKMQKAWADFAKGPAKGPGWAPLGSGDQDLADLGGEGARDGITMIQKEVMDKRCPLFYDAYDPDRPKG
jgi:carboxylesterase type B